MEQEIKNRCAWCDDDPLYISYHDKEWGVPIHDDRLLFEFLILEGAQAGLSWITILKKRDNYKQAFHNFDYNKIAQYTEQDVKRLLANPGIIRNRLKIESSIKNAKATLNIQKEFGSLDTYLWSFVDGKSIRSFWKSLAEVPVQTEISERMSKDLKKRGFTFVGPIICYSFMQAVGMVNDHMTDCFRYQQLTKTFE